MEHKYAKRYICAALAALTLLGGCTAPASGGAQDPAAPDEAQSPAQGYETTLPVSVLGGDGEFSLLWDPGDSLDPYVCSSSLNADVSELIYEPLFTVNASFEAEPVLCSYWSTDDGVTWTFTLRAGIDTHGGDTLDADDAVHSIKRATASKRYSARLSCIRSVSAESALSFTIKLSRANYSLPLLLDLPILCASNDSSNYPDGTGPYIYSPGSLQEDGSAKLTAFSGHRSYDSLPIRTVGLRTASSAALADAFTEWKIDILSIDPFDNILENIHSDHEKRYYDTTSLHYVGFNASNPVLANANIRRALSYAVDRAYIAENIYGDLMLSAPIALPSFLPYYDYTWEAGTDYSLQKLSAIFARLGMDDLDSDGYLDYPTGENSWKPLKIMFIVNEESENKIAAAQKIADSLKSVGVDITLSVLPWREYTKALDSGDFDMYYAEVKLSADLDLTRLLTPGQTINYGNMGDDKCAEFTEKFLASRGKDKSDAAGVLCRYITQTAPIIPIIYERRAVITHRGAVSGAEFTQSSLFSGISGWEINTG